MSDIDPLRTHWHEVSFGGEQLQSPTDLAVRQYTHLLWIDPDTALPVLIDVEASVKGNRFGPNHLAQPSKLLLPPPKKRDNGSQARIVFNPAKQPVRMGVKVPSVAPAGASALRAHFAFAGNERGLKVQYVRYFVWVGIEASYCERKHSERLQETGHACNRSMLMSAFHPMRTFAPCPLSTHREHYLGSASRNGSTWQNASIQTSKFGAI